jgi:hypothetical protein
MDQFLPVLPTKDEFWTSNRFKKAMQSALPYFVFLLLGAPLAAHQEV